MPQTAHEGRVEISPRRMLVVVGIAELSGGKQNQQS